MKYFIKLQGTWGNLKYNMKPIITFTQVVFLQECPQKSLSIGKNTLCDLFDYKSIKSGR